MGGVSHIQPRTRRGGRSESLLVSASEEGYFERIILIHAGPISLLALQMHSPTFSILLCAREAGLPGPHQQTLSHSRGRKASQETSPPFLFPGSESCSLPSFFKPRDMGTLLLLALGYCISLSSFLHLIHNSFQNK